MIPSSSTEPAGRSLRPRAVVTSDPATQMQASITPAMLASLAGRVTAVEEPADDPLASLDDLAQVLARCEEEREKLEQLVADAQTLTQQQNAGVSARQLAQVPALDAWISSRLAELHHADASLARREEKLTRLEKSLTALAQNLASQVQQLSQSQADMLQTQQTLDQADERIDALQTRCAKALDDLDKRFETLSMGVVHRLEAVRQPIEAWLDQRLEEYETTVNQRVDQLHQPVLDQLQSWEEQYDQQLEEQAQALQAKAAAVKHGLIENLDQQLAQVQALMDEKAKTLAPQLADEKLEAMEYQARAMVSQAQARIAEELEVVRMQLPALLDTLASQARQGMEERISDFHQVVDQAYCKVISQSGQRVDDIVAMLESQMNEVDHRLRQKLSTLSGDARTMLDVIEKQLARRVDAIHSRVREKVGQAGGAEGE